MTSRAWFFVALLATPAAWADEPVSTTEETPGRGGSGPAEAPSAIATALLTAANAELGRASELMLPDQPPPYFVSYEVLDGDVATAATTFGALTSFDHGPYRTMRVDVRVGDYALDNSNFDVSFGEREGVDSRLLPEDPDIVAFRRELWLATDSAYKGATEQLSAKLAAREGHPGEFPPDLGRVEPITTPAQGRPSVNGVGVKKIAEDLSAPLGAWADLEEGSALVRDWQGTRLLASTEGTRAWLRTGFTVVRVEAVGRAPDGARLRGLRWWVTRTQDDLPPLADMEREVTEMARWVDALRDAPVEEDYLGPVLFEEPAAVELFRQLLLPEMSGTPPMEAPPDPFSESTSTPPTARIGRRLLPEGWTVFDDPTAWPEAAGAYDVDFEGVPARRVDVVHDGVVRDLLMSRIPTRELQHSTGHGRSLGTDRRVAMPGVVRVEPRRGRSMRMLRKRALDLAREAGLPYVIVVRRLEPPPLAEDFRVAFSGDAPLPGLTRPLEAYRLYPDGHEVPVRGLEFMGVDRRVLRDISMAGDVGDPVGVMDTGPGTRRFNLGPVGGLPVTWMVPPVVVTELELRGQGGREPRVVPMPPADPKALTLSPPE